jgi:hypothetical protein
MQGTLSCSRKYENPAGCVQCRRAVGRPDYDPPGHLPVVVVGGGIRLVASWGTVENTTHAPWVSYRCWWRAGGT